ncbi:MAG: four helix bundle protein [Chthoniobacterales bacterium]
MNAECGTRNTELKQLTFEFGVRVVRLVEALPRSATAQVIGRQLLRAGTSVGANYRAAKRARSRPEFVAKLGICEEECDESIYWIELLIALGVVKESRAAELCQEANELVAILVTSIKTARENRVKK